MPEDKINKPSRRELRDKRFDDLIDSCQDQVLQNVIGPFGLTPAMFKDKKGGNVTTTRNFKEGLTANTDDAERHGEWMTSIKDPINRGHYDQDIKLDRNGEPVKNKNGEIQKTSFSTNKKREIYKRIKVGDPVNSDYTGETLGTKTKNGVDKTKEIHLDHIISIENIERDPKNHLFLEGKSSKERQSSRVDLARNDTNLALVEGDVNRSKGSEDLKKWAEKTNTKDETQTNAEYYNIDKELSKKKYQQAKSSMEKEQIKSQVKKQGGELLKTGANEAIKNGVRQALGIALHELANGSFIEIKRLIKVPSLKDDFIDHLIQAIKNVAERVQGKLVKMFEALVSGGIQGFVSNLLTFLINNIWTTAAKIVTIIREGIKGLWNAIKLMINPPQGMSGLEVAREVTKIIASAITISLGMLFEESIKAFIISIPLLTPFADVIATAVTAILTGIATALVVYGIDRFFDWLNADGTEMLEAQIENLEANVDVFHKMGEILDAQFRNSKQYQLCIHQYDKIQTSLNISASSLDSAIYHAETSISTQGEIIKTGDEIIEILKINSPDKMNRQTQELEDLIANYQLGEKGLKNV